jgi:hypothetical protein
MAAGFDNIPNIAQQLTDNALGGNLSGIISTRPTAKYMSGARCVLKINHQPVGFAFNVSWRIDTIFTEINVIDNPLPEEFAPKAIKVSGQISALHIPGQGVGIQLWQPDVLSFLFHQYITIEVRDSTTDNLLFFAPKAVITSRQEDIRVDELAQVSLSFQAIGFRDEKNPEVPLGVTTQEKKTKLGDLHAETPALLDKSSNFISSILE